MDSQLSRPEELRMCAGSYRQCRKHLWAVSLELRECPCNAMEEVRRQGKAIII